MDYKSVLYQNYRKTHNAILYGELSLQKMQQDFALNDFYFKHLLPAQKNANVLDIGCGDGNFVYYLQQNGYVNAKGIDLSAEQIEAGQQLGIANLEIADLTDYLTQHIEQFDCIIARDVVEHLTRQETFDALGLISKALKPGGCFIMQVPNGQGIFFTSIFYGDYTHEMPYTFKTVRQLFLNTGFSESDCYPINPYPGSFFGKIRSLLWHCKVAKTRFWKMVETGESTGIFTSNLIARGIK